MLLSPGHSPRHISSPSPSISLSEPPTLTNDSNSIATPSVPRRKRPKVLDEDSYVAAIERIIERDFFPDISKLRDRLDWLEAVRTRDPVQIRDAQLKILERRRAVGPNRSTSGASTGTKSQTPGSTFLRSSSFTPFDVDASGQFNGNRGEGHGFDNLDDGTQSADEVDASLSLDEFFRRYTSEDNESFSRILEKVNRKRKERYDYLLEGEKEECVKLIEDAKRERVDTDGYGTSDQPVSTLEGCKYTAKNLLMYHPADRGEVPLTEGERAERLKCLTKEVNKSNTRFRGKMLDYKAKEDDTVEVLYTPVAGSTPLPMIGRDGDKMKRYDLEDLRKTPNNKFYVESGKKAENGYSFVLTPSPGPGADESPFITWGEIEGTPLRLEPEDTPIDIGGSGDGPQFRIPMPPLRDVKAHALSREASRKLKERSRMFQKPPLHSPLRGGSASPNGRTLSPAAQKFVRKAIAKSSHAVDESLRASYRGSSPAAAAAAAGVSTPKSGRSISRFGSDSNIASRSPSIKEGRNSPW